MFGEILDNVRKANPIIHCITNYVTATDCANILLACGASPVMANDACEAADITSRCSGLTLNLGTLNSKSVTAMLLSGKAANKHGIPVVFDPVGAGASKFRAETARQIMEEVKISVIRGNISEIKFLASGICGQSVIDADIADTAAENGIDYAVNLVKGFADKTGAVISATGKTDIVSDGKSTFLIFNGHYMMNRVTGAGCRLSALTAAFAAASPHKMAEAAAGAACAMGLCGEKAFASLAEHEGNATYSNRITDAVYNLSADELERGARYEIR